MQEADKLRCGRSNKLEPSATDNRTREPTKPTPPCEANQFCLNTLAFKMVDRRLDDALLAYAQMATPQSAGALYPTVADALEVATDARLIALCKLNIFDLTLNSPDKHVLGETFQEERTQAKLALIRGINSHRETNAIILPDNVTSAASTAHARNLMANTANVATLTATAKVFDDEQRVVGSKITSFIRITVDTEEARAAVARQDLYTMNGLCYKALSLSHDHYDTIMAAINGMVFTEPFNGMLTLTRIRELLIFLAELFPDAAALSATSVRQLVVRLITQSDTRYASAYHDINEFRKTAAFPQLHTLEPTEMLRLLAENILTTGRIHVPRSKAKKSQGAAGGVSNTTRHARPPRTTTPTAAAAPAASAAPAAAVPAAAATRSRFLCPPHGATSYEGKDVFLMTPPNKPHWWCTKCDGWGHNATHCPPSRYRVDMPPGGFVKASPPSRSPLC